MKLPLLQESEARPETLKDFSDTELFQKEKRKSLLESDKEKLTISFSELYEMECCPFKHHEKYILKKEEKKTIFTSYGTLMGVAIEQNIKNGNKQSWITLIKNLIKFINSYEAEDKELKKDLFTKWCTKNEISADNESYKKFLKASHLKTALSIYKEIIPYFNNELKEWDVISFEIPLLEPIEDIDLNFKGFIDCLLKHKTEDRYKIIDFKTCSYGWKDERKDTAKLYQVILYKKYWCQKNNIDFSKVECAYLLLKRTPPKNSSHIEMFDITSGERKVKNAELWMLETLKYIFKGSRIKTPEKCKFCVCEKAKQRKWY